MRSGCMTRNRADGAAARPARRCGGSKAGSVWVSSALPPPSTSKRGYHSRTPVVNVTFYSATTWTDVGRRREVPARDALRVAPASAPVWRAQRASQHEAATIPLLTDVLETAVGEFCWR